MRPSRIALVIGTRPEAIKLAPVARALSEMGEPPTLFFTGQHPGIELGEYRLDRFEALRFDIPGQPDPMLHADLVRAALTRALARPFPALMVVQGDTSSALGAARAAAALAIPLAHVEAGLRSHDPEQPWPEETNRMEIDRIADLLFAPTIGNAMNLRAERVEGDVYITGNSGIDALASLAGPLPLDRPGRWIPRRGLRILVTCHRRENWERLDGVMDALLILGEEGVRADLLLPLNASITQRMRGRLGGARNVRLLPALSHAASIEAMRRSDLLLSDSGGVQEEAPALGVPLLVLRDKTERPEALACGSARLVGTGTAAILAAVRELRRDRAALRAMAVPSLPFGDGKASPRIAFHCLHYVDQLEPDAVPRTG